MTDGKVIDLKKPATENLMQAKTEVQVERVEKGLTISPGSSLVRQRMVDAQTQKELANVILAVIPPHMPADFAVTMMKMMIVHQDCLELAKTVLQKPGLMLSVDAVDQKLHTLASKIRQTMELKVVENKKGSDDKSN